MTNRCSECGTIEGYYDGMEYQNELLEERVELLRKAIKEMEAKVRALTVSGDEDLAAVREIYRIAQEAK